MSETDVPDAALPVGVIGLGDIAQKAYLPVLTALPGLDLRLMTRDRAKLDRLGDTHRIAPADRFTDLGALIGGGIRAAFVHAATDQHVPIVEQLLTAGVDVYVDKPLDYTVDGARRLVDLAEKTGRSLSVGFNRRHAPAYVQAKERPRDLIILKKNREGLPEAARTLVFDDFIHVVDTLRFLAPGEIDHVDVRSRTRDGLVEHVVLTLAGEGFTALGVMNRVSGSTEEILEVSGADSKREVHNLAEVIDHRGQPTVRRRGDWVPVARQRGIEQIVLAFLDAVRAGRTLDARDALRTHELCELIVERIESA
ncbi:Gfo/Idh/MocA family oxidoreductase [Streptomyces sp. CB01881]|uniref:Gfo/Idh/MocA family protein n=1 Tax=Streptomyces sp. CB01881 TaxID=2078691 RepID=UPI000CDBDFDA|nr:Gfo/Idh/MocA family oxidoreductase [Streptomyces sp. CB01881]AUY53134.1 oxidoreductase [Streptomyces sp. CB01881]TYC69287.1 gfo/Idh/MocA family oxidoreductase [Streptomyces sp. CB01881]